MDRGAVWHACPAADHRRRLLLRCRSGWSGSRPTTSSAGSARSPAARRSTRWPSRPRSKTRSWPASTSCPTASCAATTTSTTSWPGCPGSRSRNAAKDFYFDYYEAALSDPLPEPEARPPGAGRWARTTSRFTAAHTDRPVKFSFTGPFSLARRIRGDAYPEPARPGPAPRPRAQRRGPGPGATRGAELLQIDEPFLAGYPEAGRSWPSRRSTSSPRACRSTWALHVCYGNRYARPLWEGHYDFLFPAVLGATGGPARPGVRPQGLRGPARCRAVSAGTATSAWASSTSRPTEVETPSWSRPGSSGPSAWSRPTG